MSDLISRQDAIDAITQRADKIDAIMQRADKIDSVYSAFWEGLIIARDIVKTIPSADRERTAKVTSLVLTSNPPQHVLICENCGGSIDKTYWKYCPNCGARLEWE